MDFKHSYIGKTLIFKCRDNIFNEINIIMYKRQLAKLIEKYNIRNIVLDVENLKVVDNNGLSAIMFARRYTRSKGGTCTLGMPRPKLQSLIKTAKLAGSFNIILRKEEYQEHLKKLVEESDREKAAREAERAKAEKAKAEKIRADKAKQEKARAEKAKAAQEAAPKETEAEKAK